MSKTVAALLVTLLVSIGSAEEKLSRGMKWVRKHPFSTMALTIIAKSSNPQQYKAANLNTLLAWKQRDDLLSQGSEAGLPWHLHIRPVTLRKSGFTDEIKTQLKNVYNKYPGCTGWTVWDEPKRSEMFEAAKVIRWLKKEFPNTLVYSNAYPRGASLERYYGDKLPESGYSYEQYLRDFSNILKADVIMYDAYIFRKGGGTSNPFSTMLTARKIGLESGKPYWTFVQSHSDDRRGYRMPSESDIRMQVFAHLTVGYTGISYFTYEDQQGPAMVNNATLERRPIYYHVAKLNQEVLNIGQALRFLKSTDVRYIAGAGSRRASEVPRWKSGAGNVAEIKNIELAPTDKPEAWRDILVGYFVDDNKQNYFMVTNLWHDEGHSASQRAVKARLTFDTRVKTIGRLSRETGRVEQLKVTDGVLELDLPGGTGDLLRIGSSKFPGVAQPKAER